MNIFWTSIDRRVEEEKLLEKKKKKEKIWESTYSLVSINREKNLFFCLVPSIFYFLSFFFGSSFAKIFSSKEVEVWGKGLEGPAWGLGRWKAVENPLKNLGSRYLFPSVGIGSLDFWKFLTLPAGYVTMETSSRPRNDTRVVVTRHGTGVVPTECQRRW